MAVWRGHLTVGESWVDATAAIPAIANAPCGYELKTSGAEVLVVFGGDQAPAEADAGVTLRFGGVPIVGTAAKVWMRRSRARRLVGGSARVAVTEADS